LSDRERRIGLNEALFREVNEQIEALNRRMPGVDDDVMHVVCECGDGACVARFELPVSEYERARKDPRRFLIAPGHEMPDVETVMERHQTYFVIEKVTPEPERIAEETDPRS
jgi:hypothetical protein